MARDKRRKGKLKELKAALSSSGVASYLREGGTDEVGEVDHSPITRRFQSCIKFEKTKLQRRTKKLTQRYRVNVAQKPACTPAFQVLNPKLPTDFPETGIRAHFPRMRVTCRGPKPKPVSLTKHKE